MFVVSIVLVCPEFVTIGLVMALICVYGQGFSPFIIFNFICSLSILAITVLLREQAISNGVSPKITTFELKGKRERYIQTQDMTFL